MPSPRKGEDKSGFVSRCMSDEESKKTFPDQKQRVAFCNSQWGNKSKSDRMNEILKNIGEALDREK